MNSILALFGFLIAATNLPSLVVSRGIRKATCNGWTLTAPKDAVLFCESVSDMLGKIHDCTVECPGDLIPDHELITCSQAGGWLPTNTPKCSEDSVKTVIIVVSVIAGVVLVVVLTIIWAKTAQRCQGKLKPSVDVDTETGNNWEAKRQRWKQMQKERKEKNQKKMSTVKSKDETQKRKKTTRRQPAKNKKSDKSTKRTQDNRKHKQKSTAVAKKGAKSTAVVEKVVKTSVRTKISTNKRYKKRPAVKVKPKGKGPWIIFGRFKRNKSKAPINKTKKKTFPKKEHIKPAQKAKQKSPKPKQQPKEITNKPPAKQALEEKLVQREEVCSSTTCSSSTSAETVIHVKPTVPPPPKKKPSVTKSPPPKKKTPPPRPPAPKVVKTDPKHSATDTSSSSHASLDDLHGKQQVEKVNTKDPASHPKSKAKGRTKRDSSSTKEDKSRRPMQRPSRKRNKRNSESSDDSDVPKNPYNNYPAACFRQYEDHEHDYRRTTGEYHPQYEVVKLIPLQNTKSQAKKKEEEEAARQKTTEEEDRKKREKLKPTGGVKYIEIPMAPTASIVDTRRSGKLRKQRLNRREKDDYNYSDSNCDDCESYDSYSSDDGEESKSPKSKKRQIEDEMIISNSHDVKRRSEKHSEKKYRRSKRNKI